MRSAKLTKLTQAEKVDGDEILGPRPSRRGRLSPAIKHGGGCLARNTLRMPGRAPRRGEARLGPAQSRAANVLLKRRWTLATEWSESEKQELVASINALDVFRGSAAYSVRKLDDWLNNARYRARAKEARRLPGSWSRESRELARSKQRLRSLDALPLPEWAAGDDPSGGAGLADDQMNFPEGWLSDLFADSPGTRGGAHGTVGAWMDHWALFTVTNGPGGDDDDEWACLQRLEAYVRSYADEYNKSALSSGYNLSACPLSKALDLNSSFSASMQERGWSVAARERWQRFVTEVEEFTPEVEDWMRPYLRRFAGIRGNVSKGVVKGVLRRDGRTTDEIEAFARIIFERSDDGCCTGDSSSAGGAAPTADVVGTGSAVDVSTDRRFKPLLLMLKVGVPFPQVAQKMRLHGYVDERRGDRLEFSAQELRAFEEQVRKGKCN
jgi:hypothetical protein